MSVKDSIKKSFIGYALVLIGITTILFAAFMVYYTKAITEKDNIEINQTILNRVQKQYENYYREIDLLSKDETIRVFLENRIDESRVYEILYHFNNLQEIKSIFYVSDAMGNVLVSNSIQKDSPYFQNPTTNSALFRRIQNKPSQIISEVNFTQYEFKRRSVYSFGKAVYQDDRVLGYIIFDLMEEDWNKFIYNEIVNIVVVSDRFDNIIVTTNNIVQGSMGKFRPSNRSRSHVTIGHTPYFLHENQLEDSGIKVITLTSLNFQRQLRLFGFTFIALLGIAMVLLIIYLSDKISVRNTRSIDKLIYAVNQFQQGHLDYTVEMNTGDEFEILGNQFNLLITETKNLLAKNNEMADRKRISEIKQLEAQFNPHFIFNVLEVLKYVVVMDRPKAIPMIMALANLLRYSIHYDHPLVSLKKDIGYIHDYLMLQKMRYHERLQYDIDIEAVLMTCTVPKLVILPIVENCINHGYRQKESLSIFISGHAQNGNLILTIRDDGDGMDIETLQALKTMLADENATTDHIGLHNAHRSLMLLYGNDYGLQIESTLGEGVTVIITLPLVEERSNA